MIIVGPPRVRYKSGVELDDGGAPDKDDRCALVVHTRSTERTVRLAVEAMPAVMGSERQD